MTSSTRAMPRIRITSSPDEHFVLEDVTSNLPDMETLDVDAEQLSRWQRVMADYEATQYEMRRAYAEHFRREHYELCMSDPVLASYMAGAGFTLGYEDELAAQYDWRSALGEDLVLVLEEQAEGDWWLSARSRITSERLAVTNGSLESLVGVAEDARRTGNAEPVARHAAAMRRDELTRLRGQLREMEDKGLDLGESDFLAMVLSRHGFVQMMDAPAPTYALMSPDAESYLCVTPTAGGWMLTLESGPDEQKVLATGPVTRLIEEAILRVPIEAGRRRSRSL